MALRSPPSMDRNVYISVNTRPQLIDAIQAEIKWRPPSCRTFRVWGDLFQRLQMGRAGAYQMLCYKEGQIETAQSID